MSQCFSLFYNDAVETIELPDPQEKILPYITWGRFQDFFTPAYWYTQVWASEKHGFHGTQRLGASLAEEIAICLLGGYGMVAEHGLAAFEKLRGHGFFSGYLSSEEKIMQVLQTPLYIGSRQVYYRYPRQRSKYLYQAMRKLEEEAPPQLNDREFRSWLMSFNGIGPKTASWITRNWLSSDNVAVIDIHIQRSGMIIGLFVPQLNPIKDYFEMEKLFLNFASAIRVRASVLDAVMWSHMRMMKKVALRVAADIHANMLN
jgi:N-glycosylase/DNA lyase